MAGLPSPFTVLTGVFGEGELGPVRQPRHPCAQPLARLLLTAGADANDAQALYNRMFEPGNDHLELLFEFGLGQDTGGPWLGRLGEALGSPASTLRGQLAWAITHGMTDRVRLLAEHWWCGRPCWAARTSSGCSSAWASTSTPKGGPTGSAPASGRPRCITRPGRATSIWSGS